MVKAPSFGGERTKYTPDMPGSNPAAKKVHRGGLVLKSRPLVTVAGVSQIFEGQDGRVVKAGALGDAHVKLWDRTWSNPGFEKVHIARCVGFNHVRDSIWRRHLPIF